MDLLINPRLRELLCFRKRKDIYGKENTEIYQIEITPAEYYLILVLANNCKTKCKDIMNYMSKALDRPISFTSLRQYVYRLHQKGINFKGYYRAYQLKDEVWFV